MEGLRRARRRRADGRHRDRARLRDPVLAGPPVAEGASRVVQPPSRRDAQVRGEPAQALPGHLQRQLRVRGLARALAGAPRRRARLGRARRHRVPRRQPAHEARRVLGVADPRGAQLEHPEVIFLAEAFTRPGDDDDAREARLRPELHVLHLEEHEAGAAGVRRPGARLAALLPAEHVHEHTRHPPRVPPGRRAACVRGAARARGDAVAVVRHLLRVRVVRERPRARRAPRSTSTRRSTR